MSSTQRIIKHYKRLLTLWPKDPVRPTLPFHSALEHRLAKFTPNTAAATQNGAPSKSSSTSAKATSSNKLPDTQTELLNINALYSLLENRYAKRYPTSPALLRPASNPEYYEKLMAEIEKIPNKSWLQAKLDKWKMMVRWQ